MRWPAAFFLLILLLGGPAVLAEELFDAQASNEHFERGLSLYFEKDYSKAIEEFNEAVRIDPENARAFYFLGYAYYKQKEFDKSREAFDTAYEMDSRYSPVSPAPGAPEEVELNSGSPN
jgi:tetratricopeptide (TPR) repeat protein